MSKSNDNEAMQIKEAADLIAEEWLGEAKFVVQVMGQLDDALILFETKRATLEEKIIKNYIHGMLAQYADILQQIHLQLANRSPCQSADAIEQLRTINLRVHDLSCELLKALRYNFNFVEQYFEYNYYTRLSQEERLLEELRAVSGRLRDDG